jgi:hypothetical protein
MRREKFEGYKTVEFCIPGFIHNAHAALTELLQYLVM